MRILLLLTFISLIAAVGCDQPKPKPTQAGYMPFYAELGEYAVVDTAKGAFTSYDAIIKAMLAADVIFVGEEHDHTLGHMLEASLLKDLYAAGATRLTVSFEMFERDVQHYLDEYLAGNISEKEFRENSRPWPNYDPDYRPMIEFAKANSLPAIAANIPRSLAMAVATKGIEGIEEQSKRFVAKELYAPDDEYKARFIETMKAMGGNHSNPRAMPVNEKMLDAIYRAQCSKDDTMAESITNHISLTGRKVIHYNGCFHSDFGFGTAARVARNMPNLKVLVIKMTRSEEKITLPIENFDSRIANFLVVFTK